MHGSTVLKAKKVFYAAYSSVISFHSERTFEYPAYCLISPNLKKIVTIFFIYTLTLHSSYVC